MNQEFIYQEFIYQEVISKERKGLKKYSAILNGHTSESERAPNCGQQNQ
jgi:hypothetical protein